jgi:soluble lytic murein transglycosylase-like protein
LRTQPLAAGPANYAQDPVDLRRDRDEEVAGFSIAEKAGLADMTRKYARQHGIPLALLHRIIMRESKYCPRLVNRRYFGLMQITPATARSMGYHGAPKGLLDPETNLAYAAPYLANAWALADGDMDRAVRLYASGYYYTAKSKNMLSQMRDASSPPVQPPVQSIASAPPPPRQPGNIFEAMFSSPNQ